VPALFFQPALALMKEKKNYDGEKQIMKALAVLS
jgi:hypothetical protein